MDISTIHGYHAHVYFDKSSVDRARHLCERASETLNVIMGRVHEKNVGPHPRWSCQLAFKPEEFAAVIPWLALNRDEFTVFVHPETGDDLSDHTAHALWMGEMLDLKLDIFKSKT